MTITASNTDNTITSKVPLNYADDVLKIAVPVSICDLIKTIKQESVEMAFNTDTETPTLSVKLNGGTYEYFCTSATDYPNEFCGDSLDSKLSDCQSITFPVTDLKQAIDKTINCVSKDEFHIIMTGVCMDIKPDKISFTATDAHKLSIMEYPNNNPHIIDSRIVITAKAMSVLKSILPATNTLISIDYNKEYVRFKFENTTVISKLIDGRYPNVNNVLPYENNKILKTSRKQLIDILKRMLPLVNQCTHTIIFDVESKKLTIKVKDSETNIDRTEAMPCSYNDENMMIGFNVKFLMDILPKIDTDNVVFKMESPDRAVLILPADETNIMTSLIMPVLLI